jgi:hypothetical protein
VAYSHTLSIKNEETDNLQETLLDFVAYFGHFGGFLSLTVHQARELHLQSRAFFSASIPHPTIPHSRQSTQDKWGYYIHPPLGHTVLLYLYRQLLYLISSTLILQHPSTPARKSAGLLASKHLSSICFLQSSLQNCGVYCILPGKKWYLWT